MKETVQQTVVDTLDYLMTIVRSGMRPEQATSGLRPLQTRHPEVDMQLIWEEEPYDHSVHYDALLNLPDNGTISISYCDEGAKPWPVRGVLRWSDSDLVRVNNYKMSVDQAIACLDFIWDEARITDRLLNGCLIEEELAKHSIELSDDELQSAMDAFRRAKKLYKTEDTYRWIERRGISMKNLEKLVGNQATILKLREKLVAGRVQDYFDTHKSDFDTAYIARFSLADRASAQELVERIRKESVDFFAAAQSSFIEGKQSRNEARSLFSSIQRREAPVEIRESLFQWGTGSVLGPVHEGDGYSIIRVLSVVRASLDDSTREAIRKILFDEWLEERRKAATIDWFWGNASNTAREAQ